MSAPESSPLEPGLHGFSSLDAVPLDPARLRPDYAATLAAPRVLLTGHSHQAWPDVAREGLLESFEDAALHVDDKWDRALAAAADVRSIVGEHLGVAADEIALGTSTHELLVRFLSSLDLRRRPRVVTTDGEFHSARRQLARLEEEGIEIVRVAARPVSTLAERLIAKIDERTAAALVSTVLFGTSEVVPELCAVAERASAVSAEVLFDAYHAFMVVPFSMASLGEHAHLVAGGYKYAEWGEGVCFLRAPTARPARPIYTGWFAEFAQLSSAPKGGVAYGAAPFERYAGSTYDPASHYRARRVARFFRERSMTVPRLAALYSRQTSRLIEGLDGHDVLTPREPAARGGFVSVRVANAAEVVSALRARQVYVDARGDMVRLGPAPFVLDEEIDRALDGFRRVARREHGA